MERSLDAAVGIRHDAAKLGATDATYQSQVAFHARPPLSRVARLRLVKHALGRVSHQLVTRLQLLSEQIVFALEILDLDILRVQALLEQCYLVCSASWIGLEELVSVMVRLQLGIVVLLQRYGLHRHLVSIKLGFWAD